MKEMHIQAEKPQSAITRMALQAAGEQEGANRRKPMPLSDINATQEPRMDLLDGELNRVLGGGLVPGSLVLLGGEPGIGKSTLVLQTVLALKDKRILYVSGEESARQIKLRAERLAPEAGGEERDSLLVFTETSLEQIYLQIQETRPDLVVIDSIQTISTEGVESSPGSLSQIRECAASLLRYAKSGGVSILLIGHITKEGSLAGPKVLEHIVDAVLLFEGDSKYMYRILRPIKNRFGSTNELGIYEMVQRGLREVTNPSELLLTHSGDELSGIAVGVTLEGIRPFLIEVQALVSTAAYGTPQRSVTGFDSKRMNMLLAVLEKRVGFKLAAKDVFLNITGGLRVSDPAIDLAVVCAILSSNVDMAIPQGWCMAGEVGLSGEIRPVTRAEQRIMEAQKLGMTDILVARDSLKGIDSSRLKIRVHEAAKVEDAFRLLFAPS